MANIMESVKNWAIAGAVAGAGTQIVFYLLGLINISVMVGVPFATVGVQRTGEAATVAAKILAPLGANFQMDGLFGGILMAALYGAIFVALGGVIFDSALSNMKVNKQQKLMIVLLVAGLVGGWLVAMQVSIPAIAAIIPMLISAFVVSYIYAAVAAKYIP